MIKTCLAAGCVLAALSCAAAEVGVTHAGEGWIGGLEVRHVGSHALMENGAGRPRATTLVSARIGWRFSARTQVTLDVLNLFDRTASDIEYYSVARLPGEGEARNDVPFQAVEPRGVRLTLRHEF